MAKILHKIVNGVSEVLSAPSVLKSRLRQQKSDFNRSIVRDARNYDNAPDYDEKGRITRAFKVRSLRTGIKSAK